MVSNLMPAWGFLMRDSLEGGELVRYCCDDRFAKRVPRDYVDVFLSYCR